MAKQTGNPVLMKVMVDITMATAKYHRVNFDIHQYKESITPDGESDSELLQRVINDVGTAIPAIQNALISVEKALAIPGIPNDIAKDLEVHKLWCQLTIDDLQLLDSKITQMIMTKSDYVQLLSSILSPYYDTADLEEDFSAFMEEGPEYEDEEEGYGEQIDPFSSYGGDEQEEEDVDEPEDDSEDDLIIKRMDDTVDDYRGPKPDLFDDVPRGKDIEIEPEGEEVPAKVSGKGMSWIQAHIAPDTYDEYYGYRMNHVMQSFDQEGADKVIRMYNNITKRYETKVNAMESQGYILEEIQDALDVDEPAALSLMQDLVAQDAILDYINANSEEFSDYIMNEVDGTFVPVSSLQGEDSEEEVPEPPKEAKTDASNDVQAEAIILMMNEMEALKKKIDTMASENEKLRQDNVLLTAQMTDYKPPKEANIDDMMKKIKRTGLKADPPKIEEKKDEEPMFEVGYPDDPVVVEEPIKKEEARTGVLDSVSGRASEVISKAKGAVRKTATKSTGKRKTSKRKSSKKSSSAKKKAEVKDEKPEEGSE